VKGEAICKFQPPAAVKRTKSGNPRLCRFSL
jgi:hypothetical protein